LLKLKQYDRQTDIQMNRPTGSQDYTYHISRLFDNMQKLHTAGYQKSQ